MKKLFAFGLLLTMIIAGASSCKKYEEGPGLSLRSKTKRLTGTWNISKATEQGADVFSSYAKGYQIEFKDDNTFTLTENLNEFSGNWSFIEDKTKIELKISDGTIIKFIIIQLKHKEMILDQDIEGAAHRLFFVKSDI